MDHDCSTSGFEGIRAQDILERILAQGFKPWKFLGIGGAIDVFIDRCFGHNFDKDNPDDAFLLRRIGFLNEVLLDAGLVKPTIMFAYFVKQPVAEIHYRNRSAANCVRDTTSDPAWLRAASQDFARSPVDPNFEFKSPPTTHVPPEAAPDQAILDGMALSLRRAEFKLTAAQARIADQARRIEGLERSSSWRLTAPLRLMVGALRRQQLR
jgi:hypothetical protein